MEPNSSPAVSEASMLQIVVVRMSERISTWGPNRQAQVAVANIRQHHFANMRQHAANMRLTLATGLDSVDPT
jgi:hypothetical protein